MISVSRAINGITINGDEFLLDDNNELLTFEDETIARKWLHERGVTEEEIASFTFIDEDNEDGQADRLYFIKG